VNELCARAARKCPRKLRTVMVTMEEVLHPRKVHLVGLSRLR
jgi:hypothetical protein